MITQTNPTVKRTVHNTGTPPQIRRLSAQMRANLRARDTIERKVKALKLTAEMLAEETGNTRTIDAIYRLMDQYSRQSAHLAQQFNTLYDLANSLVK